MNAGVDAAAGIGMALAAACLAGYIAFSLGPILTAPPVKSDRELCKERGGIYVTQHHRPAMCLAKEAFK